MYGASLDIFNVHVQRPWATKFHPNRTNLPELWPNVDFPRWRSRRGNSASDFVFWPLHSIRKVEIYLHPKFWWHFSNHCWYITNDVSWNKCPPCWNFTSGFHFHLCIIIAITHCISLPTFIQIGTPTDELRRHNDFHYGGRCIVFLLSVSFFVTSFN